MRSAIEEAVERLGPRGLHDALTPAQRQALPYVWPLWARPLEPVPGKARTFRGQIAPPGDWTVCLFLGGKGTGKTRALAEWCRAKAEQHPGCRIHLVGRDMAEARKVGVFGESGILERCPPWDRPDWSPVDGALRWRNGSLLSLFSAEVPASMRGPQCHFLAADELAVWGKGRPEAAWRLALLGCRLGRHPQAFVATTPAPIPLLRDLIARPTTVILRGRMRDNPYLPESHMAEMESLYSGTAFGRQELDGELLDKAEGALFAATLLDKFRVAKAPALRKVVIACDPSASTAREHDEAGLIVLGEGMDGHAYVLEDLSGTLTPEQWGGRICEAFHRWHAAYVLAETQKGGKLVQTIIRQSPGGANVPVRPVPAQLAKETRAQPVAAAAENGRLHLVGIFEDLERELCTWVPGGNWSPGRLDALVHGALDILVRRPLGSTTGGSTTRIPAPPSERFGRNAPGGWRRL